tara:strand:- start:760 stop:1074 length:315 start_codon:yes stop_codon:yes gene_type:complete
MNLILNSSKESIMNTPKINVPKINKATADHYLDISMYSFLFGYFSAKLIIAILTLLLIPGINIIVFAWFCYKVARLAKEYHLMDDLHNAYRDSTNKAKAEAASI